MLDGETKKEDPKDQSSEERGGALLAIWEAVKVIFISLAIILPIRYYLVQPFFVKGASMEPNFEDGDYILIDEISYRFNEPSRGDVIIFRYPENHAEFFIKRVIGLPGETVEIKDNRVIVYNSQFPKGEELKERYLAGFQKTMGNFTVKLDGNEFYVLGDNRLQSSDSRRWGPVDRSLITGRAFIRPWPFRRFSEIGHWQYSYQ